MQQIVLSVGQKEGAGRGGVVGCWEGLLHWDIPTSLGTFVQVGMVRAVCTCV